MPRRLFIEDAVDFASKKEGNCLSQEYVNAKIPLLWQCAKGHEWKATLDNVRSKGSWCPTCQGLKPHTIWECRAVAKQKGGSCLSTEYAGENTKLLWECSLGHRWEAVPKTILAKIKPTWCPYCAKNRPVKIEEMQQLAIKRGGECISTEYLGDGKKLVWKCTCGHYFSGTPSNVKRGRWCPSCSTSLGERLTRAAFEQLFGIPFPRVWPGWLSAISGSNLELDGYAEEARVAFEHQGEQHYKNLRYFHRERHSFEALKQRDALKRDACEKAGVLLIVVPEVPRRLSIDKLADFVIREVRQKIASWTPNCIPGHVCYDGVFHTSNFLNQLRKCQKFAEIRGGSLVSDYYAGVFASLEW